MLGNNNAKQWGFEPSPKIQHDKNKGSRELHHQNEHKDQKLQLGVHMKKQMEIINLYCEFPGDFNLQLKS